MYTTRSNAPNPGLSLIALAAITLTAQSAHTPAPRLWTDQAVKGFALPIAGVNAAPTFYSDAEYYATNPRTPFGARG